MRLLSIFLLGASCWAGQSIVLTSGAVHNTSIPGQGQTSARVEVSFHNWDTSFVGCATIWAPEAVGFYIGLCSNSGSPYAFFTDYLAVGGGACQIPVGSLTFMTLRLQRVTAQSINTCEAWDVNGNYLAVSGYSGHQATYSSLSGSTANRVCVSGIGGYPCDGASTLQMDTAYFRVYTTTVATGATPPTTAQSLTGCLVSWKFDLGNNTGSLNDSCGAGPYNASTFAGSVSYTATVGQTLVKAIAKSGAYDAGCKCGIPAWDPWAPWVSARVGHVNSLDGTASYSQADASPAVTYAWSFISGPMTPSITGPTTGTPTYTPTLFGTYTPRLVVTDAASNTGTVDLSLGAAAYDDNGVVIQSDPNVEKIFGPMTAFGQNPWGYEDERDFTMVGLQNTYFQGWPAVVSPTWQTLGAGTISYVFAGRGISPGIAGTTITSGINATDTSIAIADASKIPGLANLPTWIMITADASQVTGWTGELIRITATTATSGAATLTVGYSGRGLSAWTNPPTEPIPGDFPGTKYAHAQSWSSGAAVSESRVFGSSTLFASDSNVPICPGGVPGPPGPVTYSTGTVTLSSGSTTITGSGTNWTNGNGVYANYFIRVSATHASGTPFVWWSIINSITDTTHLVTDVAPPSGVDGTAFAYKIVSFRYAALQFQAPDAAGGTATHLGLQLTAGCESETAMFYVPARDISVIDQTTMTGKYTYDDALGIQSQFGPNFYGSGLALRAFYYRSGYEFANTTANLMDETWVKNPEIAGGWYGGIPLLQGGAVIGAIADLVLNPSTALAWTDVRRFAEAGAIGSTACYAYDSRDSSALESWTTLAAQYDPDTAQRAVWASYVGSGANTLLSREQACKGSDNSWANASYLASGDHTFTGLTVTNGSPYVTGTGIPSGACYGVASGNNITVTNGSASFTGTGFTNGEAIWIMGTTGGGATQLPTRLRFSQSGGTSGSLAALWPGDSGTFSYVIESSYYMTAIAVDQADVMMSENWACTWNSSTQITLNRGWDGASGSGRTLWQYPQTGKGQQPYMLGGYKTLFFRWASQLAGAIGSGFAALMALSSHWVQTTGYDPQTQGMFYSAVFQGCPTVTATVVSRARPGTTDGGTCDAGNLGASRTLAAEAGVSLGANYVGQSYSPSAKTWGDTVYGSIWGYCPWTAPGFYCDASYVSQETSDSGLGGAKWPGFFFGVGMAHQWPAMRMQGVYAPSTFKGTFTGTGHER